MKTTIPTLIIASSLGLASGAVAQQQGRQDQPYPQTRRERAASADDERSMRAGSPREQAQRGRQGQQTGRQGSSQMTELQGRVIGLRRKTIGGEEHLLAKIRTHRGQTMLFDLGSTQDLRESGVRFKKQGAVRARGQAARLGNTPVLVVERFKLDDGPTVVVGTFLPRGLEAGIDRQQGQGQMGQGQQGQGMQGQGMQRQRGQQARGRQGLQGQRGSMASGTVALCGKIEDARKYSVDGMPDEHRFIKVRLKNGKSVIVDIGVEPIEDLALRRGERVWVMGRMGRINDRPVVFATHLADLATIDWSSVQGQGQQGQTSQQQGQRSGRNRQRGSIEVWGYDEGQTQQGQSQRTRQNSQQDEDIEAWGYNEGQPEQDRNPAFGKQNRDE